MGTHRVAAVVGAALALTFGTTYVAGADPGGTHKGGGEEASPPGVIGTWGDIVNGTSATTNLGFVDGYSESTSVTSGAGNLSAFITFPGVESMSGHENIYQYRACVPAGQECTTTSPGTRDTVGLDECNPCTMYTSTGTLIGSGSIDMPWWSARATGAVGETHQQVALLTNGTGGLTDVHGVLIHPSKTDPRCAAKAAEPHFVGCYWGTVHSDECITGEWHGPLRVAAGTSACVSRGAKILGPTSVAHNGELFAEGATFQGPIRSDGADGFQLCASTVAGPVSVTGTTGPVLIGEPANGECGGNLIGGPLDVEDNGCATCDTDGMDTGAVDISGNTVAGPLRSRGNVGTYVFGYFFANTVSGPVVNQDNT